MRQMGNNYADMDEFVKRLDRDRVRLVAKLKARKAGLFRIDSVVVDAATGFTRTPSLTYIKRSRTTAVCGVWERRDYSLLPLRSFPEVGQGTDFV